MHAPIDTAQLADAQHVADKLTELPKDALLFVAGYVEGRLDQRKASERVPPQ